MDTSDPRFFRALSAPFTFRGVGPFAAVHVLILSDVTGLANGYRFRPLADRRAEDAPEPLWVELPGEWFAADATPTEERALAVIEAFLAAPPVPRLDAAGVIALAQRTLDGWALAWGYDTIGRACTYIGDPYPRFNAEGLALRNARSAVWAFLDAQRAVVTTGPLPTAEEVGALLATFAPVRPEA